MHNWSIQTIEQRRPQAHTLVLGLGNPILTDDGVGVWVAEAIAARLPADLPIDCTEVSVGGLLLMEAMLGYERVILIDALYPARGRPGTIHRLTMEDLRAISPTEHSTSPHDTSLLTALDLGHGMGLPVPAEIIIYAVEVENISDFGDTPTPAVAHAIPQVIDAVMDELALQDWNRGFDAYPPVPGCVNTPASYREAHTGLARHRRECSNVFMC